MKTKKIHFPIVPPTKTSGKIHVPPHLPAMHGIQIWVGRRNAGKSVAATNLIKRYLDIGVIERVILVSPTYESNMHTFAPLKLDPTQDVIEPTKDAVQKVKEKLEEETKEWEAYHEKKKEWEAYQKHMRSTTQGITSNQLLGWEELGF